jgi:hypothetical protein
MPAMLALCPHDARTVILGSGDQPATHTHTGMPCRSSHPESSLRGGPVTSAMPRIAWRTRRASAPGERRTSTKGTAARVHHTAPNMPQRERLAPSRAERGVPQQTTYARKKEVDRSGEARCCCSCSPTTPARPTRRPHSPARAPAPPGPVKDPKSAKAASTQNASFKAALGGMTRNVEMITAGKLLNEGRILR